MEAYIFLAIGVIWLVAVVSLLVYVMTHQTGLVVFSWPKWRLDHATSMLLLRILLPVVFLGWIIPVAVGCWLLWRK